MTSPVGILTFEEKERRRRLENERGRAYRAMLEAGHKFADDESAPEWACELSLLQHCGARHFEALDWPRVWLRAVRDPAWHRAFLAVVDMENAAAEGLRGQLRSQYETGRRIAKWLAAQATRQRRKP